MSRKLQGHLLFVGYLPAGINEEQVRQLFGEEYAPKEVLIVRSFVETVWPKGCALVTFEDDQTAEFARFNTNGKLVDVPKEEVPEHVQRRFKSDPPVEGDEEKPELPQQWRIMVAHGIIDPRDRNCANVQVLGVPAGTEIQDLEPELAKYGKIASSKIGRVNQTNAWFSYFDIEHANAAHNQKIFFNGHELTIQRLGRQLFILNLSPVSFSEEDLYERFRVYGEIEKISVNKHPDNLKVTLELATVDFQSPNDADNALTDMTGPKVNTHTWKIMRATNKAFNEILLRFLGRNKEKIRLVKNLPENITENMFLHLLLQFGMVRSCHVPCITNVSYDADGNANTQFKTKGVARIEFLNDIEGERVVEQLKKMRIGGNELSVLPWLPTKEVAQRMKAKFEKQQKMARGAPMYGGRGGPGLGINMLRDPTLLGRGRMARPMQMNQPKVNVAPPTAPPQAAPVRPQIPQAQPVSNEIPGMNMQVYNSVPDDKKKYMLGTAIYQILLRTYPEKLTSKLTGMVLEMQIPDLEAMIKDLNKLKACINAAKEVLRKHFTEVGDPDNLLEFLNLSM